MKVEFIGMDKKLGGVGLRWKKISDAVVRRLPLYLRVLDELAKDADANLISSQELGKRAGVGSALVRKDLTWFGEFGKQGVGYEVKYLRKELRNILNLENDIDVALVGVGSLGEALTRYNGRRYSEKDNFNLHITALFDNDPDKIGQKYYGAEVYPVDKITEVIKKNQIKMGIITVPESEAQAVGEALVTGGIKAILNFAPVKLDLPKEVHVSIADLTLELQRLAYYLDDE